jgi:hypothetical protein
MAIAREDRHVYPLAPHRETLAAKVQLTHIRASRLRERVNLDLALGGDFEGTGAPK